MMQFVKQGKLTLEMLVEKMCHAPAICYRIAERGFIRSGYFADLVLVNPSESWRVQTENILSKCGWSLFEGMQFDTSVEMTFVNGYPVYNNGKINENVKGKRIVFKR
jgi:dihydroorotase